MPRPGKKEAYTDAEISGTSRLDLEDDTLGASPLRDETPIVAKGQASRKRPNEANEEFGFEMQKMLECFGADISKTMINKRKRLEEFTQPLVRNSNKRLDDIWKGQQTERTKLSDEYHKQLTTVFQQWEVDLDKTKEQEERLTTLFRQQQKLFQQARAVQSQRLRTIRELHEQYTKGVGDLDKCHLQQHSSVQTELRKEMALLQKKILMETQHQEMANVKKSLQSMLSEI